jgi:prepilin-type N-terminal cleavage/methylation domain-containing protein
MPVSRVQRLIARMHGRHSGHLATTRSDSGFALTEVLVATVILAIIGAAAVMAINTGVSSASVTHQRVVTANVAQQAVQQAVTMPRASLTATPTPAATTVTVGNGKYRVSRSIGYSPTGANACPTANVVGTPYAIVVHVVASPVAGSTRSVQMDTVIAC